MAVVTGPGVYRSVPDQELLIVWHLVPRTVYLLEIFPITPSVLPGRDLPQVKPFLRRMLYLPRIGPSDLEQLIREITAYRDARRDNIAIGAKLLSLIRLFFEKPYAFPALLPTNILYQYRDAMRTGADVTRLPANGTASTPVAAALGVLSRVGGVAVAHTSYVATLINRNYEHYVQMMEREIALRGRNPELAPAPAPSRSTPVASAR